MKREDVKMRRCEDEKMRYRPPLLEEPCAQTLSGTIITCACVKTTNSLVNYNGFRKISKGCSFCMVSTVLWKHCKLGGRIAIGKNRQPFHSFCLVISSKNKDYPGKRPATVWGRLGE